MKAVAAFLLALCHLALSDAWNCAEAPYLHNAYQIDAGQGKVVARDRNYYPYFLIGSSWHRISAIRFRHVSAGSAGLWGAGTNNRVYKYVAGHFRLSYGRRMKQVDAGGDDHVVGVTTSRYANCLRRGLTLAYSGVSSLGWTSMSRRMSYISCSPQNGCWGVGLNYRVYYTQRINRATCVITAWRLVPGLNLKMVEISTDGSIFGLTRNGKIYQRLGMSRRFPHGTRWVHVPMCMGIRHMSYDLHKLWVVTNAGTVLKCRH